MNIGFDAKRLFFSDGGLGNYARSTVEVLLKYAPENHYTLFTPGEGNRYGFGTDGSVGVITPQGIRAWSGTLWRRYAMSRAIRVSGADIYHGLSGELPADILRAGVRSVVTVHDINFVRHPEFYTPFTRTMRTRLYMESCRKADRIIAISRSTAADLMDCWDIPPEKIDVVYQCCSHKFERIVPDRQLRETAVKYSLPAEYIFSVGAMDERRNLLQVVRAMAEGKLDVDLVACGRHTHYADKVVEFAARQGMGSRVHMLHEVDFDDLPALYQMASVFVFPSLCEGFCVPILEAFNSRVPVLTTSGGAFAEAGGDACLYVDPGSSEEIAAGLRRLMSDTALRKELISRGTAHARGFREPTAAEELMKVYRGLIK